MSSSESNLGVPLTQSNDADGSRDRHLANSTPSAGPARGQPQRARSTSVPTDSRPEEQGRNESDSVMMITAQSFAAPSADGSAVRSRQRSLTSVRSLASKPARLKPKAEPILFSNPELIVNIGIASEQPAATKPAALGGAGGSNLESNGTRLSVPALQGAYTPKAGSAVPASGVKPNIVDVDPWLAEYRSNAHPAIVESHAPTSNFNTSFYQSTHVSLSASLAGSVARTRPRSDTLLRATQVEELGDKRLMRQRAILPYDAAHRFNQSERDRMAKYESIDYWEPISEVYKDFLEQRKKQWRGMKWLVFALIGFITGIWGALLFMTNDTLLDLKVELLNWVSSHYNHPAIGYGFLLACNVPAVLLGSLVLVRVPSAAGSGVPDVMAYLNGVCFPKVFNIRNLSSKTIGTIMTVTSGLPAGAEGPMIHIGALIGAGLPTGRSRTLRCSATGIFAPFRNAHDQRDFIAGGAAAGVAVAFNAPIGALLFVMEELASFFPVKLAFMVFFCTLMTTFSLRIFDSYVDKYKFRPQPNGTFIGDLNEAAIILFNPGVLGSLAKIPINIFGVFPSAVLGLVLGLWAVLFTTFNSLVIKFRAKFITVSTPRRVVEPILVVLLYSSLCYWTPMLFDCITTPPEFTKALDAKTFRAYCPDGQYNPMATLSLTSPYNVLKILFSRNTAHVIPPIPLLIWFLLYSTFASYVPGMFISGGFLIPTLMIGATGGRLFSVLLYPTIEFMEPGVYSLVGAAAFFGGLSRLTFSLAVIMMEMTSDIRSLLFILIAITVGKITADRLIHSLYHIQLESKCVPFLDLDQRIAKLDNNLCAKDVASSPVVAFTSLVKVSTIIQTLKATSYNAFPIVSHRDGTLKGILLRRQVEEVLWYYYDLYTEDTLRPDEDFNIPAVYTELQQTREKMFWNRRPGVPPPNAVYEEMELDLTPYMDASPFIVTETTAVSRAYLLFRSLGLRHLVVVSQQHVPVGIITRKDLIGDTLLRRLEELTAERCKWESESDNAEGFPEVATLKSLNSDSTATRSAADHQHKRQ